MSRVAKTHRMPYIAGFLPAKEPRIIGLFCGEWPRKIRRLMGILHPVLASILRRVRCNTHIGCKTMQHTTTHNTTHTHNPMQHTTTHNTTHTHNPCTHRHLVHTTTDVCCSVLQCVEVCCSVLQCDDVCCSVLQLSIGLLLEKRRVKWLHVRIWECLLAECMTKSHLSVCKPSIYACLTWLSTGVPFEWRRVKDWVCVPCKFSKSQLDSQFI